MEMAHTAEGRSVYGPGGETMEETLCFECDGTVGTIWCRHTFTYGLGAGAVDLSVELPVRRCRSCGFEFLDHEAETLQHAAICAHFGLLTPAAIRRIRQRYGTSRCSFCKVTGIREEDLRRWEEGIVIQSLLADRYLRFLASRDLQERND